MRRRLLEGLLGAILLLALLTPLAVPGPFQTTPAPPAAQPPQRVQPGRILTKPRTLHRKRHRVHHVAPRVHRVAPRLIYIPPVRVYVAPAPRGHGHGKHKGRR